jgi:16S rRNA (cytidine1402-2'-O)-methyltransferase
MLESILSVCCDGTRLCIAIDITLATENIRTLTISEWKKNKPSINDRLVIFVLQ